ncbi:MAG: N-acetylmuramoyl-L-alanine amidase [Elusimicrobia bacterium]|nr:N-acetylmuramoyl-L-alanine amidase [Elusimicrobiota bacterium]
MNRGVLLSGLWFTSVAFAWAQPAPVVFSTPSIKVNYPEFDRKVGAQRAVFILGNVQPPESNFRINGSSVPLYHNGGFLAYLPVAHGTFTFVCEAEFSGSTSTLDHRIYVSKSLEPGVADERTIEEEFTWPRKDVELKPGDWLRVQIKAAPRMKGYFQIKGVDGEWPLAEGAGSGLYSGAYQIQPEDKLKRAAIRFFLKGKKGKVKAKASGLVTVLRGPWAVAVVAPGKSDSAVVRTGPLTGYMMFLPGGVKVLVDGKMGDESRLWLSDAESGWIETSKLEFLPRATPQPRAVLSSAGTQASSSATYALLGMSDKVPFQAELLEDDFLRLKLYHTYAYLNWIVYDSSDTFVDWIRWRQEATQVAAVEIKTKKPMLGYDAYYENGILKVEIRHPPVFAPPPKSALDERLIVLDPGHSPSDPGRIGPMGLTERELNLRTALLLKPLLEKEGARVLLTRDADIEVSLQDRVRLAQSVKADAFLSLHNNALGDGENPFLLPHGFSLFYYHPHSMPLAQKIREAYKRNVPLYDEGLRYGNIMVARMSLMPAALVESAYFIFPDQEAMLNDPVFQEKLARSLLEGLKGFFEDMRKRVGPPPAVRAPAVAQPQENKTLPSGLETMPVQNKKKEPSKPASKSKKSAPKSRGKRNP